MGLRLWNIAKSVFKNSQNVFEKRLSSNLFYQPKTFLKKRSVFLQAISSKLSSFGIARKFQYLIAIGIVVFVFGSAVYFVHQIYALTLYFTQSDWSGGADTNTTINSSNATGWTKFYSKTAGMDNTTSGEVKLKLETSP